MHQIDVSATLCRALFIIILSHCFSLMNTGKSISESHTSNKLNTLMIYFCDLNYASISRTLLFLKGCSTKLTGFRTDTKFTFLSEALSLSGPIGIKRHRSISHVPTASYPANVLEGVPS